jgi:hypothetical protein
MWEDNIKMNRKELALVTIDWIELAEDRNHWKAVDNTVIIE